MSAKKMPDHDKSPNKYGRWAAAEVAALVARGPGAMSVEPVPAQRLGPDDVEVTLVVGGICGSDLHYFHDGAVGDFKIREPLILGHEVTGLVSRVGSNVQGVVLGERVAIDPSSPCGNCAPCQSGARNLCSRGRFLGSAAKMPHIQGGFRERLVVQSEQIVPLPDSLDFKSAVFAEPLAVALHAAARSGSLLGKRVLVSGAGPIGTLITMVAVRAGAASVAVTDLVDAPLEVAASVGARTANVSRKPLDLDDIDVAFEASGAPTALQGGVGSLRPGGRLVLVGLQPLTSGPPIANRVVARELEIAGSFRFVGSEFRAAVGVLAAGLDVSPLLSARFPLCDARTAFETASRENALKVQLVFCDM
jgi:L-idonate 5-dehydrogenase